MGVRDQTWDPLEKQQRDLTVKPSLQLLLWYFLGEGIIVIFVLKTILHRFSNKTVYTAVTMTSFTQIYIFEICEYIRGIYFL